MTNYNKNKLDNTSPQFIIDNTDPGDDTLLRFRYQISFAGILSVLMLDSEDYEEVYCEHHEDVLIKHRDTTFTGIQVKTKDINLPPFTIEDEAIIKSLKKFVDLDSKFPEKFKGFSIVSNHGFDRSKPAVCVNTLIENAKKGIDLLKPRSKTKNLIVLLAEECGCNTADVIECLKKMKLKTFCNLEDIHMKLINQLKRCSLLNGMTESKIEEIADSIIAKHFKASSLHEQDEEIVLKYIIGKSTMDDEIIRKIENKCINKRDFTIWLEKEKTQPIKVLLKDKQALNLHQGHKVLQIKMDAGGIDSENIDNLRDFKFAFEKHTTDWLYKSDPETAEGKYSQVLAITQNLCKEVYDEQNIANITSAGQQMLIKVRQEIKTRQAKEPDVFFDCSYEHLLGAVGVLTESCKVWWSAKFPIEE